MISFRLSSSLISFSFRRRTLMSCRLGVCQLNSNDDKRRNLRIVEELIEEGKEKKVQMIFLPEAFDYICSSKELTLREAESVDGPLIHSYRGLAKKHQLWISLGGFHEKTKNKDRVLNTHLIIDNQGEIVARYSKIHLFDVQSGSLNYSESSFTQPGEEIVRPISTPVGRLALGICYDVRFVEMSRLLSLMGAQLLSYPSAFTEKTGEGHWEILLRARAIENQCFVVAAAQVGEHPGGRRTFGHSMVVDPWGKIVLDLKAEHPSIGVIDIDLQSIVETRKKMSIIEHRRSDLYQLIETRTMKMKSILDFDREEKIRWGQIQISSNQIFFQTEFTFAIVNRKPVVKGHVLVSPFRCVERFSQLTSEEISDLFLSVQHISQRIEQFYQGKSSTICIQDGQFAGQTIRHVHVHILPRHEGDFDENDSVYLRLSEHDRVQSGWRTEDEMKEEAQSLRNLFLFTDNIVSSH